jgi:hypothetical protein
MFGRDSQSIAHGDNLMNQPIVEDLVTASHILASEGVLDGLGHISVRHSDNPEGYLMSRAVAPALVMPSDIMEYDLDFQRPRPAGPSAVSRTFYPRRDLQSTVRRYGSNSQPFADRHSVQHQPDAIAACVQRSRILVSIRAGVRYS